VGDVAKEEDAQRAVSETVAHFGHLDVLINCAAVGGNAALAETDADRIDAMFAINVRGTLLMARAAAAEMVPRGRGRIINVSSIMGHRAAPKSFLYGASKAAVGHATRSLAVELGSAGVTVNCVSPANTPTQLREVGEAPGAAPVTQSNSAGNATKIPLGRRGELDDYVGPILFFASDLATYVTGADVLCDGGLSLLRA
jgi:NAD(P)-dependent dehydrogenase (short-subunit alcohol dehydrogenase family)